MTCGVFDDDREEEKNRKKRSKKKGGGGDQLEPPRSTYQALDRMMFQIIPRLQYRRMHLLHRVPQLHSKPTEDISLP